MKRLLLGWAVALVAGGTASAQDFGPGWLPANANLANAAGMAPPGIVVAAVGRARLPASAAAPFDFSVEGRASSAVQALAIRDARLKQVRIIAEQFAAEIDVTDAGFSTALDTVAQAKRIQEMQAERTAHPGIVVPFDNGSIPQLIVARTTVRVRGLPLVKVAAFIDAMSAAGVDDLPNMLNNAGSVTTLLMLRTLGLSPIPIDDVDPEALGQADANAVVAARRQAQDIAAAAGRALGPVEQVTNVLKTVQGDEVVVTLAVRFAFAPEK